MGAPSGTTKVEINGEASNVLSPFLSCGECVEKNYDGVGFVALKTKGEENLLLLNMGVLVWG